jgi:hypothetical protein
MGRRIAFVVPRGDQTHLHKVGTLRTLCERPASVFGEELPEEQADWLAPLLPWCEVCLDRAGLTTT